ncbi:hypothetical protein HYFRA_00004964 [Hymenoscyphus fraxineus]|uniref:Tetratricopeptide repeat protein 1 n=1 Tax=Hymenoscyphus fraxineus TaxID=746836 RepID=A0A9N9KLS8_9HELO|nr:hypothetical protein HYFRA_00004964 [Hymenoscyphus fraxineus]
MASRSERFARKPEEKKDETKPVDTEEEVVRFSAEEEAALLNESNAQKTSANALFAKSSFQEAIATYDEALSTCPNYLDYEIAVLKSNIAACHLKLEDWKEAVKSSTAALDCLDKLQGRNSDGTKQEEAKEHIKAEEEEADEEIVSEGATKSAPMREEISPEKAKREADIERIRAKALMRRAKARSEQGGWSVLQGAEEDYKTLSQMPNISLADKRIIQQQLRTLPPRTKAAQEKETKEMMDKLKQASFVHQDQHFPKPNIV